MYRSSFLLPSRSILTLLSLATSLACELHYLASKSRKSAFDACADCCYSHREYRTATCTLACRNYLINRITRLGSDKIMQPPKQSQHTGHLQFEFLHMILHQGFPAYQDRCRVHSLRLIWNRLWMRWCKKGSCIMP